MSDSTEIVKSSVSKLMEHFDAVHIFATRYNSETGNTETFQHGSGNYFARVGQILQFKAQFDECERENQRQYLKEDGE